MEAQDAPKVLYTNSHKTRDRKPGMVCVIHSLDQPKFNTLQTGEADLRF